MAFKYLAKLITSVTIMKDLKERSSNDVSCAPCTVRTVLKEAMVSAWAYFQRYYFSSSLFLALCDFHCKKIPLAFFYDDTLGSVSCPLWEKFSYAAVSK